MGRLKPSSAKVWLNCPKNPTLTELVPYVETDFTLRGTHLHLIAAYAVRDAIGIPQIPMEFKSDRVADFESKAYINYCNSLVKETFTDYGKVPHYMVEEKLSLEAFLHEGNHGIVDFCAYDDETVLVCDYKTGFVKVSAINNDQLTLYALAMVYRLQSMSYEPKRVRIAICQPSQDNYSVYTLSVEELLAWLDARKEAIDDAYYNAGNYTPGSHCGLCNGRAVCKAYLSYKLTGGQEDAESETD